VRDIFGAKEEKKIERFSSTAKKTNWGEGGGRRREKKACLLWSRASNQWTGGEVAGREAITMQLFFRGLDRSSLIDASSGDDVAAVKRRIEEREGRSHTHTNTTHTHTHKLLTE